MNSNKGLSEVEKRDKKYDKHLKASLISMSHKEKLESSSHRLG
jgi:hypothetical protein